MSIHVERVYAEVYVLSLGTTTMGTEHVLLVHSMGTYGGCGDAY